MRFSLASTVVAVLGATLLVAHLISPAASDPVQTTPASSETGDAAVKAGVARAEPAMPGLAEVNIELARLQGRLDAPVVQPPVGRNPFDFGDRPERRRAEPAPMIVEQPFEPIQMVATPMLVAILSDTIDGRIVRTAVFSVNDDVAFMSSGDDVTQFRVDAVGSETVVLVDRLSGRTITLSLN